MKVGFLGAGTWGFTLASLLASKGYQVTLWSHDAAHMKQMAKTRCHPKLAHYPTDENMIFTSDLDEALSHADVIAESVTSQGIRNVFQKIKDIGSIKVPIIITSKGIEQNSCLLLPEVVIDVLGDAVRPQIACLSGPSHAEEVIQKLPTAIVASAYDPLLIPKIHDLFTTPYFRIYPNQDMSGVCLGGALKNIIAIACGISDGLKFGDNTKAALITRGLHEMARLAKLKGALAQTLNGLSGLGDLCVTCLSLHSRNSRFGRLIGQGVKAQEAQQQVGMVVEGIYTCKSAMQMAKEGGVEVPITQAVYSILYEDMNPKDAVKQLLQRAIREEHL
jgi:glycerol-3-phosphate dehydrogenase (NAD(P)+)